jgi:putative salt-induced outer membrane protein YdiY
MQKIYSFTLPLFLFVLLSSHAFAFLNIEALRQNPEPGFKGNSGLRLSGAMGNTQRVVGSVHTMNAYRTDKREVLALASYEYGSSFKVKNSNKGTLHARYAERMAQRWKAEGFAQMQFDEFRRLNSRKLLGTGLRHELFLTNRHSVYLGGGAFYEWEELKDLPNENDLRGNFYLSYLYKPESTSMLGASVITYFQPLVDAPEDNRLIVDSGLQFRITGQISYTLTMLMARDTRPPPNVKRTDWTYLTGFNITY